MTFTVLVLVTCFVVTLNALLVVAPAGTVTVAGTVAIAALLTERLTVKPPDGALKFSVTVPLLDFPPFTEAGESVTATGTGGFTTKDWVIELDPIVAVMLAVVGVATAPVVTVKVWLVEPPDTVAEAGTVAAALSLVSATETPSEDAVVEIVTVPWELCVPKTGFAENVSDVSVGGFTDRFC